METKPFFSVVIPLFNKEDYIEDTLNSVLNQSYKHFEVIIVNDGSNDNSLSIIKSISDSRINIINQENRGLSGARNSGIKASKYDFIAFLDADDLWCQDYLKTIFQLIQFNKESKIFATDVKVIGTKQNADLNSKKYSTTNTQLISFYFKLKTNIFGFSSIVIHKSIFNEIGAFDNTVNYGEEEDFFIRCFSVYKINYYSSPKVYYRKGILNQLTSPNSIIQRNIPDYSKYLNKNNYRELKPYIDFIYFKLVVLYKMQRNHKLVKLYKEKIEVSNLSLIRKIKFYLPTQIFYNLKCFYVWFLNRFTQV